MSNSSFPSSSNVLFQFRFSQLLALFDSEDPRERDFLKTTLHRIYGEFTLYKVWAKSSSLLFFS